MIYMMVEERLPRAPMHQNKFDKSPERADGDVHWDQPPEGPSDEQEKLIVQEVFQHLNEFDPGMFLDEFEASFKRKEQYLEQCGEKTCEEFLKSNAYQGWKNRKSRGPSLLFANGASRYFRG